MFEEVFFKYLKLILFFWEIHIKDHQTKNQDFKRNFNFLLRASRSKHPDFLESLQGTVDQKTRFDKEFLQGHLTERALSFRDFLNKKFYRPSKQYSLILREHFQGPLRKDSDFSYNFCKNLPSNYCDLLKGNVSKDICIFKKKKFKDLPANIHWFFEEKFPRISSSTSNW